MTSIELMIAAFNKCARKSMEEIFVENENKKNFSVTSCVSYESEDFLYDLTKEYKFKDNLISIKCSPHHTSQIDIILSNGQEIDVCYEKSIEDPEIILLSKDIECLCFLFVYEDINAAIENYGSRAIRLMHYGL